MRLKNQHLSMRKKIYFLLLFSFLLSCAEAPKKVRSPLFANPQPLPADLSKVALVPQKAAFEKQVKRREKEAVAEKVRIVAAAAKAEAARRTTVNRSTAEASDFINYTAQNKVNLSYVARGLLGSPKKISLIKKWNPGLKAQTLAKGEQLKIRKDALNPKPMLLPKELILQYPSELSQSLVKPKRPKVYVTRAKDTLQKISKKNYVTTRRWTEIFLLNFNKIKNPDNLEVGLKLELK